MKIFIMIEDFIISTWFLSLWLIEPNTTLSLQQKIKRRQHTKKLQTYDYCQNFFPQFLSNPLLNKLQSFFSCFREDIPHRSTTSSTCCVTLFVRPISLQHTHALLLNSILINNLSYLSLFLHQIVSFHLNLERRISSLIHMTCILSCSHGVVIATAMVFSSTALFLTISRQLCGNNQPSDIQDQHILRPCLCSGTFLSFLTILRPEKSF